MSKAARAVEATLVLMRIYNAPIERVWKAWTEQSELSRWYVAGDDHIVHFCEADVRVGGTYRIGFAPPDKTPVVETGCYLEVLPFKRLVFEEVVTVEGKQMHPSKCEIDFVDLGGGGTKLVLTVRGEQVWRSGEGWVPCLESLARHLGE
jgi:uncharacterized protein YndB with AHSA1/START domain